MSRRSLINGHRPADSANDIIRTRNVKQHSVTRFQTDGSPFYFGG